MNIYVFITILLYPRQSCSVDFTALDFSGDMENQKPIRKMPPWAVPNELVKRKLVTSKTTVEKPADDWQDKYKNLFVSSSEMDKFLDYTGMKDEDLENIEKSDEEVEEIYEELENNSQDDKPALIHKFGKDLGENRSGVINFQGEGGDESVSFELWNMLEDLKKQKAKEEDKKKLMEMSLKMESLEEKTNRILKQLGHRDHVVSDEGKEKNKTRKAMKIFEQFNNFSEVEVDDLRRFPKVGPFVKNLTSSTIIALSKNITSLPFVTKRTPNSTQIFFNYPTTPSEDNLSLTNILRDDVSTRNLQRSINDFSQPETLFMEQLWATTRSTPTESRNLLTKPPSASPSPSTPPPPHSIIKTQLLRKLIEKVIDKINSLYLHNILHKLKDNPLFNQDLPVRNELISSFMNKIINNDLDSNETLEDPPKKLSPKDPLKMFKRKRLDAQKSTSSVRLQRVASPLKIVKFKVTQIRPHNDTHVVEKDTPPLSLENLNKLVKALLRMKRERVRAKKVNRVGKESTVDKVLQKLMNKDQSRRKRRFKELHLKRSNGVEDLSRNNKFLSNNKL